MMSYYNKVGEKLGKEAAARLLRGGGIVYSAGEKERSGKHYSCWNLKGNDKRCEVAKFAPPSTFDPRWKIVYQGPDPWFAKEVGVITPGVAAQIKEEERWA